MNSQIIRVSTGVINTVQDTVIGGTPSQFDDTLSATAGQLGKTVEFDSSSLVFDSSVSNCFPGRYQYVLLDPAEPASPATEAGDLLYFNGDADEYQVTATPDSGDEAGYCIVPGWTPGTYGFIFSYGQPESFLPTPAV